MEDQNLNEKLAKIREALIARAKCVPIITSLGREIIKCPDGLYVLKKSQLYIVIEKKDKVEA